MSDWTAHCSRVWLAVVLGSLAMMLAAFGQAPRPAPAQFDPSDVYFQGYLAVRASEQLESAGDFVGALEKLEKANELFRAVSNYHPDWKPHMVEGRSAKTAETIGRVRPLAEAAMMKNRNAVAELEGGVKKFTRPADDLLPPAPNILQVDPLVTRQLKQAEDELQRLRSLSNTASGQLKQAEQERQRLRTLSANAANEATRNAARAAELSRQRDELAAKLRAAEQAAKLQAAETNGKADAEKELSRLRALSANAASEASQNAARAAELSRQRDELAAKLRATEASAKTQAEQELNRLRALSTNASNEASNNATRAAELSRQRDELEAKLRAAETNVEGLRARLLAAPVQSEMTALNRRIETLEQERSAMAMALTQSRSAHTDALSKIATLEADLNVMRQKQADLERNLDKERKVSNSVVAGQRRQLDALERELAQKSTELTQANERILKLTNELQESRDAFAELRSERDSLLQERDQMAGLLKLNEAGRIQDLIEQNMSLAKNLREANEKVERLFNESNSDKDDYTDALRDLAIAKSQINRLHQEKREQDRRLAELETRLKNEEQALAQGKVSADPAEIEMLRDIVRRQLRVQERRRQARDLLVEAAGELGAKDERLAEAIELFKAQEVALSPEEQKLIADREVDGEFISPFARDRATVGRATTELNRDISTFERTAEKSFVAGRMLPTRELYQMILDLHPGHTPSLCKLGIVHLKLDEPSSAVDAFRRAVELDSGNPYAFRMLGFSLMKMGDLTAAEEAARRCVDLAPTDVKNQILLATLCYRLGRASEAESHFKAAINADPMPSEPYYNLALIYARSGRMDDAREYYQKAIERGALPDPALEKKLALP